MRLRQPNFIRCPEDGCVQKEASDRQLTTEKSHVRSYPDCEEEPFSQTYRLKGER